MAEAAQAVPKPAPRKPRVTDMVLYRVDVNGAAEHPAVVTKVFEPTADTVGYAVNLSVFYDGGSVLPRLTVPYDASDAPKTGTWRWPPRG